MGKTVEFYFDFGSPASYLAWTQLPDIAARAGAQIAWRPVLLGGIFQATGNRSPAEIPAKGVYMFRDLARFAQRYGVPFNLNPHFPINTLQLMRGAIAFQHRKPESFQRYVEAIFKAIWVDGLNLNDPAAVGGVLGRAGLNPQEVLAMVGEQEIKDKLRAETDAAVKRGLFGVPTMFVEEEMFFGQDRLDFVTAALERAV
jgi:2-hydroxychromene-2-carboxylate isomerase